MAVTPAALAVAVSTRHHGGERPAAGPHPATSPCYRLFVTLTYNGNRRDIAINSTILVLVLTSLVTGTAIGTLNLSALFWAPVALLISALQAVAAVVTQQEGFSLIWCTLVGLMIYEQARWNAFTSEGAFLMAAAATTAAAAGLAVAYYACEELVCDEPSDLSGLRGPRWCLTSIWDRLGTTLVHVVCLGLGALLGALADTHVSRVGGFWTILTIGAIGAAMLPIFLCHARHLRCACSLASVQPEPPIIELNAEELAVANLQQQLLKTRDEIAWLSSKQGSEAFVKRASSADSIDAGSGETGGANQDVEAPPVGDDGAPGGAAAAAAALLEAKMTQLVKRESTLLDKLQQRDQDITA